MSFFHLFANQIENQLSIPDRLMKQSNPFLFPPTGSLLALSHFALFIYLGSFLSLSGFFFFLKTFLFVLGILFSGLLLLFLPTISNVLRGICYKTVFNLRV